MTEQVALSVHRCRFVDFLPSAITALAFPPWPLPKDKGKKPASSAKFGTLAIGHANGNIDLCEWTGDIQSAQAWVVRKTLVGLHPSKVDTLLFALSNPEEIKEDEVPRLSDLRLFNSGGGNELMEWDIARGCIRRTIGSKGGSIWSMALNPASTKLALGCEDGTVRLLSIANDGLTHYRRFDHAKSRHLSICWGPPVSVRSKDSDQYEWSDSWLVTGGSDGSIRKWEVSSGRVLDRMTAEKVRGERTLIWAVGVLGDGTIISGDSLGMAKFWDSRTCTQLQSFQAHRADILCLAVGPDGATVYSSGVDQKVVQYVLIKTSKVEQGATTTSTRWAQTSSRRLHSHDVRALAIWPTYSPLPSTCKREFPLDVAPILASGGLDMSVVVTPAASPSTFVKIMNPLLTSVEATFGDSYHRKFAYTTAPSCTLALKLARKARLVSCMRDSGLSVWRILTLAPPPSEEDLEEGAPSQDRQNGGWEKVLEMDLSVQTNLAASALSDDGRWLVASDMYETRLFRLESDSEGVLKPKRIRDFASILKPHLPSSTGGVAFVFTPDSTKLVMSAAMSSYILVIDLGTKNPQVLRRFDHHRRKEPLHRVIKVKQTGDKDSDVEMADPEESESDFDEVSNANVSRLAVSADGQWLATSDDQCRTHIYNLDSVQHHCALPSFPLHAQALAFDPTHPNLLTLVFPNNTIQIYDVEARQFPPWAKALCSSLPKRLTQAHDPVIGVIFSPNPAQRYLLLWGSTWLTKIRLDGSVISATGFNNKRRRDNAVPDPGVEEQDFKMVTQYRPILFVDLLGEGELIVVERPLVDVLATLPPAYFKTKYGAS